MPYYFYYNSPIWHLNAIFFWKLSQLLLGDIIVDKLKNLLWAVFSYFDTKVPTPNKQPFIPFLIMTTYFCSDIQLFIFSYMLLYCSDLDVSIFDDIIKFELNSCLKGEYFKILVYYFISIVVPYQNITLLFFIVLLCFSIKKYRIRSFLFLSFLFHMQFS